MTHLAKIPTLPLAVGDPIRGMLDELVNKLVLASGLAAAAFRVHTGAEKSSRTVESLLKELRTELTENVEPMVTVAAWELRRCDVERKRRSRGQKRIA